VTVALFNVMCIATIFVFYRLRKCHRQRSASPVRTFAWILPCDLLKNRFFFSIVPYVLLQIRLLNTKLLKVF
jgi:hypothetical protein